MGQDLLDAFGLFDESNEESLRQALSISQGSFAIVVTHPISLAFLLATAVSLTGPAIAWAWRRRRAADSA